MGSKLGDLLLSLGFFSDIIFFIPNNRSFNLEREDYLSFDLSDSNLFLFLLEVYIKFLKDIFEIFLVKEPGLTVLVV